VVAKKLELMKVLQQKLAGVGRTDDKLDREVNALEAQMAEWQAAEDANRPKAKRATALNVIKDGAGTAARVPSQKVD
jgi:septal ring factor EnvC (AmiA/AmiB activator)